MRAALVDVAPSGPLRLIEMGRGRETAMHGPLLGRLANYLKIDELLRVHGEAKTGLTQIDREQPEEIEEHRKQTEREDRGSR